MSLEPHCGSEEDFGSLKGCLVDGDLEQRARERRIRRRALAISVAVQAAIVTALVLVPLFGRTEHIALASTIPIQAYHPIGDERSSPPQDLPIRHHFTALCAACPPVHIPPRVPPSDVDPPQDPFAGITPGGGREHPQSGWELNNDSGRQPAPPSEPRSLKPPRIQVTHLEQAMLIHRVDPVYPILPRQMGREGRVELHAIIATDGTIQFLQAIRGDPLFYQSALEAVRQWRYRPTVLNGQPMEIDTQITVIYTMQR